MEILYYIIAAVAGAVIALSAYIVIRKYTLNGKKDEIIRKAEIEGENIKKEKTQGRTRAIHQ